MQDNASKIKGAVWLLVAFLLAFVFTLGFSPLVKKIPWGWERSLARMLVTTSVKNACPKNVPAQALLNQLIKRIYPLDQEDKKIAIDVIVAKDDAINAYAELGGRITLNAGLLKEAQSAEEIAGVLAHEIAHVQQRHILEAIIIRMLTLEGMQLIFSGDASRIDWTSYFLHMRFTRLEESKADEAGLQRLAKAHVNNTGFKNFFQRLSKDSSESFFSDHPTNDARINMVDKFPNQDTKNLMTPNEWKTLKNYCTAS